MENMMRKINEWERKVGITGKLKREKEGKLKEQHKKEKANQQRIEERKEKLKEMKNKLKKKQ